MISTTGDLTHVVSDCPGPGFTKGSLQSTGSSESNFFSGLQEIFVRGCGGLRESDELGQWSIGRVVNWESDELGEC